jgi:hypothetical protein
MAATSSSTWTSWREALKVVSQPSHLKKTAALAFVIGTIFFAINQLGLVLSGHADGVVWAKTLMTYLTPFCVSNYSILGATRARGRDRL